MGLVLEKTAALPAPTGRLVDLWEKEFLQLADRFPVWVSYIDAQERFQYANVTCAAWLARPISEIIDMKTEEVISEGYQTLKPLIGDALAGREVTFEGDVGFPDRLRRHVSILFAPDLNDLGQVVGFYAFVVDLTRQRAAQLRLGEFRDGRSSAHAPAPALDSLLAPVVGFVDIPACALPRAGMLHETPSLALEAVYGAMTPTAQHVVCLRREMRGRERVKARTLNDEIASGTYLSVQPFQGDRGDVAALRVVRDSLADISLEGPVTRRNSAAGTITLLGVTVAIAEDAEILDADGAPIKRAAFLGRIRLGTTVRVALAPLSSCVAKRSSFGLAN